MARKPASAGTCAFCGREVAGTGMTKHLATCSERQAAIDRLLENVPTEEEGEEQTA